MLREVKAAQQQRPADMNIAGSRAVSRRDFLKWGLVSVGSLMFVSSFGKGLITFAQEMRTVEIPKKIDAKTIAYLRENTTNFFMDRVMFRDKELIAICCDEFKMPPEVLKKYPGAGDIGAAAYWGGTFTGVSTFAKSTVDTWGGRLYNKKCLTTIKPAGDILVARGTIDDSYHELSIDNEALVNKSRSIIFRKPVSDVAFERGDDESKMNAIVYYIDADGIWRAEIDLVRGHIPDETEILLGFMDNGKETIIEREDLWNTKAKQFFPKYFASAD